MKKGLILVGLVGTMNALMATEPLYKPLAVRAIGDGNGFEKGRFYVHAGMGALNLNSIMANKIKQSIAPKWQSLKYDGSPIWFAKAEYAASSRSGLGLNFAMSGFNIDASLPDSFTKLNIPVSGKLTYKTWSLLGRYNFHFFPESAFDLYAGIGLGFRSNTFSVSDNDPDKNWWNFPVNLNFLEKVIPNQVSVPTMGADMTLGFKYYVAPPVAIYAEFGVAKSVAQGGVVFKF